MFIRLLSSQFSLFLSDALLDKFHLDSFSLRLCSQDHNADLKCSSAGRRVHFYMFSLPCHVTELQANSDLFN